MLSPSSSKAAHWAIWLLVAAVVIALDQLSKFVVLTHLLHNEQIPVTFFFDLVLAYNPGAAFSFLSTASGWQREFFMAIAVGASALMVYLIRKHSSEVLFCFALSFILGGAIGNVIDRARIGAVVDFLYFHAGSHYWPAFNLADSAITCGAVLLLWDRFRRPDAKVPG